MLEDLRGQIVINTESIDKATEAIERLERTMNKSMKGTQQATQGASKGFGQMGKATQAASQQTQRYTKTAQTATKATKATNQQTLGFKSNMENLTKSTQVALGPLSGVAARITALTALFNRNAAALAAVLAGFTAFTVALGKAISAGQQFEQEMLGINAVLEATGRLSRVSAEDIGEMARRLGRDTLTSASEARQALTQLSTFQNISTDNFEETTQAALGMSRAMGGNLQSNIRRLGRLLNNPIENLSSLTRNGIEFTQAEEEKIKMLQNSGQLHEAQAVILERMGAYTKLATEESQGLAGAFDTLTERINEVFEESSVTSTLLETMADVVTRLTERLTNFLENEDAVRRLGEVFSNFSKVVGNALIFVIDNLERIAFIVTTLLVSRMVPALSTVSKSIQAVTLMTQSYIAVLRGKAVAVQAVTVSLRGMMAALGPIGIALGIVTAAYSYFNSATEESVKINDDLADAQNRLTSAAEDHTQALNKQTREKIAATRANSQYLASVAAVIGAQRAAIQREIDQVRSSIGDVRTGQYDEQIAQLNELQNRLASLGEEYENVRERQEEEEKRSERLEDQAESEATAVNNTANAVRSLLREYDREGEQARRLTLNLQTLEANRQRILDMGRGQRLELAQQLGIVSEEAEYSHSVLEKLLNTLGRVESGMRDAGPQAEDYSNQIDRVANSFRDVNDQITEVRAAMHGDPLGFEMADVRSMEELGLPQLEKVARRVGVELVGDEEQARRQLAAALHDQREQLDTLTQAQKAAESIEQDFSAMGDDLGLDAIRREFQQRRELIEQGYAGEAERRSTLMTMAKAAEQEALREQMQSQLDMEFQFNEHSGQTQKEQIMAFYAERRRMVMDALSEEAEVRYALMEEINAREEKALEQTMDSRKAIVEQAIGEMGTMIEQMATSFSMIGDGFENTLGGMTNMMGHMTDIMKQSLGEQHSAYKNFATAQAIMAGALAVNKAMTATENTYVNMALAAMVGAKTGAQIAAIRSQSYADGGLVRGPGTSRSDSISANLSNGEFVMQASAVRDIGIGNLMAMNSGRTPQFAGGGAVGMVGGSSTSVEVIDQRSSGDPVEIEEETDAQGERRIRAIVKDAYRENMRRGVHDRDIQSRYRVRRRGLRR